MLPVEIIKSIERFVLLKRTGTREILKDKNKLSR